MALELLGESVFAVLYDGVKQAIGKTGTFKYLLRDIKSTLESLNKLHATAIRQIGEYNLELGLPNDEVEDLKQQMEEGAKLVGKLSDFRVWNYCCLNCYTDQLVDLDRSLKRLLDNIKLQETRDVKEILDLLRKYRVELDELKGMLHMLLQQRAGDVTETSNSTAATSTETMPQQSEGNGEHEQGASFGGADLGAVYRVLFDVVTEVKDKTMMFRPLLGDLKFKLDSLKPLIEEIAQHNNVLVLPNEELEKFRIQMDKGVELVRKCSKVRAWVSYKKYNYTIRLIGLNESIRLQLSRLREQVAREVSETLASISNLKEAVKKIEVARVIQNQLEMTGSCEVPEPSSPTVMRESEDSVEVHPLPLPLGANLTSPKVLITTEPESQPMKGQWIKGKLIGRGTFGSVYLATNRETGALCAMKEVDFIPVHPKSAECIKQLQQEISVLSQLKHPNIVQYYGSEIVEDRFFIYQEYVHPGFRKGYIQEHCGAMTEAVARSFTRHILSGLAYLHSTKTIHWDIKWANLLVDSSGVVKLADFGMAKILSGHSYNLSLKGSPHWMAPELIKEALILNDKSSDHDLALAVDIWSLGCTIIEMLTGKPPWSELEGPQAMFNTLHKDPPIPKTLSPEGKDFLRRCLQRNPAMRSTAVMLLEHPFLKNSQPQDVPTTTHVKQKEEGSMTGIEKSFMHVLGEQVERGTVLDKSFGFSKHLSKQYELGKEVGRGNFSYTCIATFKKGKLKGQHAAVKVISKAKMTTAIAINDVRREVEILKALTGHNNIVKFYDAYEDHDNVYIVMEYCAGGELLDRILARGGKYPEDDARTVMIQILNAVAFCHLQCVVHRDLKPENFLFTSSDEDSQMKAIDFGLSDFVKPDQRLNDIVGTTYQVAPEVLHRSYSTQADMWSVGVIAYILLSGTRPFWARTESGIFRAVLKANPSFDEPPWPSLSTEAKDFVKRLLNKDYRKRMTAAQALSHLWLKNYNNVKVPLDILIFKLMKAYMLSSPLRKAALGALSKTLTPDDHCYMAEQFEQLEPDDSGTIGLENIRAALMKNANDAMKEERYADILASLNALQYRRMEFQEFCAATLCVYQLEALGQWEQQSRYAYELFDKDGNKVVVIEELASELGLNSSVPVHTVLEDWIRKTDGKLSFVGFVKLLHGVSSRTFARAE